MSTTTEDELSGQDFTPEFEDRIITAVAILLTYGMTKTEILSKLEPPAQNILGNTQRILSWTAALSHWLKAGYSYEISRALASVKHGQDSDVKLWAISIMLKETNLRLEDML